VATQRSLAVDKDTNDLVIVAGDLKFTADTVEFLAQKLTTRLLLVKNEWFLDRENGTDYYGRIFNSKTNPDLDDVRNVLLARVASTQGIKEISKFNTEFNAASRTFSVGIEAVDEFGNTITVGVTL